MKLTIDLDEEEIKILKKRAEKNLLDLNQQVENIVRRSLANYKNKTTSKDDNCDDHLVRIFSKSRRGRKKKK